MSRYENRKKEIGERIKNERENLNLNKVNFLTAIYMSPTSHKTVSAWEDGTRLPDLDSIVQMADLFDCDIGYLLCDYDEKRRVNADIVEETGLSGPAVATILSVKTDNEHIAFLNEYEDFSSFDETDLRHYSKIQILSDIISGSYINEVLTCAQKAKICKSIHWAHLGDREISPSHDLVQIKHEMQSIGHIVLPSSDACDYYARQAADIFNIIIDEFRGD